MKNCLLIFTFVIFLFPVFSQTSSIEREFTKGMVKIADDVGDFTITDSDGNTWNLYEQLDLGKIVFLDLFFTT
jgi:hypothetical protein